MAVLQFVSEHPSSSLAEAAEQFGAPRALARTTIHTVLERLRKKGYLAREMVDGVYRYAPRACAAEVMTNLVGEFFEQTLQGSLTPFVTYFQQHPELSKHEIDELRALVQSLDARQKGTGDDKR